MLDTVRAKLKELPENCHIRNHFTDSRLDRISKKIDESHCKDLEWGCWQPFFLFMQNANAAAIQALEADLKAVMERTASNRKTKLVEFLDDERECDSSWSAGLFETFVKAALLKGKGASVSVLDCDLPNKRNIDVKLQVGEREFYVECTTMGDSNADKARWQEHCGNLKEDPNAGLYTRQDAYTQGRRLYGKVYEKVANGFDLSKNQFCPGSPNFLLISFSPLLGDLMPSSLSIGWALDELFSSQPTGNKSNISLQAWLERQKKKNSLEDLLAAPRQLSGIFLFSGCKLEHARINHNAKMQFRITHSEMLIFEKILTQPPAYYC